MTEDKPTEPAFDRDRLLNWMAANGVAQTTHDHPAVFRVEEGLELKAVLPQADPHLPHEHGPETGKGHTPGHAPAPAASGEGGY